MTRPDLDALEKLAARIWSAVNDRRYPRFSDMESAAEALEALIAELKEARALLERTWPYTSTLAVGASDLHTDIHAFLARNGKGEG